MPSNRLSSQKSPYLLQHAMNPVDWYPWGEEAFEKSRREKKPIILSIGYSTCHWCHVMAHESFEDADIAAVMNEYFVAIKVDREERPDIDHLYMSAVSAMIGQGGWPLTVFLTPEAKPFYGGTYFPPYPKWGAPGFKDLLLSVAQGWQNNQADILNSSQEITELLRANFSRKDEAPATLNTDIFDKALRSFSNQFDVDNGGFGTSPKFPMGHNIMLLLRMYKNTGREEILVMVEKTLTAMAHGGIYDHIGGGFHRYSTDAKWHVPHFEKMLYDQALLLFAYAEAYQVTGNLLYASTIKETVGYLLREMQSPEGGFFSAQDADSEGVEGASYVFAFEEINELLGPDATLFCQAYGVSPGGNVVHDPHGEFSGKNVLFVSHEKQATDQNLSLIKSKLLNYRSHRSLPHLDDKVLTDWNGLLIGALAFAGSVLNQEEYIHAAARAADFLATRLLQGQKALHRWREGQADIEGMLEDYAFAALGFIYLYEATANATYLKVAVNLTDGMLELFSDEERGGFFMSAKDASDLIVRPSDIYDGALPSGNSAAALVLVKLFYLTHNENYQLNAERVFKRFYGTVLAAPSAYSFFLTALDMHLNPPVEIKVRGNLMSEYAGIANIQKVVYKHFMPSKVLIYEKESGPLQFSVCRNGACLPVVEDTASLAKILCLKEQER